MMNNIFFDETSEQSLAKATIVSKYFWAWAKVIIPSVKRRQGRIAYIDLFAGPGRYKDGTKSTPLLILEKAIRDNDMREMLVTIFNDKDGNNSQSLQKAIKLLPGIDTLKYKPQINNQEVGEEIVKMFEHRQLIPTLFFVDPWGYKGLSLRLVNSILKDWGCDCIFFFNYNRINMGLANKIVEEHMNALFGKERADSLRERLDIMQPEQRELTIVEEISQAIQKMGGKYVLPFRFNSMGNRTSHHLIFVSKHFKGYEIMKTIMAGESSKADQGVPSFEYSPAIVQQPLLFELTRPLDELAGMLLSEFANEQLTVQQVYEKHNIGKPYVLKNYKDVLKQLEVEEKITINPTAAERRKHKGEVTLADKVNVLFVPRRK
ncbi:three-Cys-motif partner protein TcmP [bacterium]|nr:three-Cys-motif partner protein TcmP [bacterium]